VVGFIDSIGAPDDSNEHLWCVNDVEKGPEYLPIQLLVSDSMFSYLG